MDSMDNRKKIFRQENLKRLSSPEDLNDVLRIVNPSGWMILISVLLILAGIFVWSIVGRVERTLEVSVEVYDGVAHFKVTDGNVLQSGMHVEIGDTVSSIRNAGRTKDGSYIGTANVPEMKNGIYEAEITVERISPIRLLFN